MPTSHVLVLFTLLLQSPPDFGDAFRVQPKRNKSRIQSGDAFGVQPMRYKSRIRSADAFGVQPMRNKSKNLSAEQENCTCGDGGPLILSGNLSEELRSKVGEGRLEKIVERLGRDSVPSAEYSLSYASIEHANTQLSRGATRWHSLGLWATEWLLFAGGYTVSFRSVQPGNAMSRFKLRNPIQHIPSEADGRRLIAYNILRAVENPKRVIVWCHSNAANIQEIFSWATNMGKALKAAVVAFEYPSYGHPDSDMGRTTVGKSTFESVRFVMLAGLNWIRQVWGVAEKDIFMAGQSIGTGAATETAWEYEVNAGNPLGGLILISPYSSVQDLVRGWIKTNVWEGVPKSITKWAIHDSIFQTRQHLSEMSLTPLFALHSPSDKMIPYDQFSDIKSVIREEYSKDGKVMFSDIPSGWDHPDAGGFGHNYNSEMMSALFHVPEKVEDDVVSGFKSWIHNAKLLADDDEERDMDIDLASWGRTSETLTRLVTPMRLAERASFCGSCGPSRPSTR